MTEYSHGIAWIDLDAIRGNALALRANTTEGTRFCAVVKADGYGHGAVPAARALRGIADYYAVAMVEEGVQLRAHGITEPILCLGYTPACDYETAIDAKIRMNIFSFEAAQRLSAAAAAASKTADIHIKLETGMNRLGFAPDNESLEQIIAISRMPGINIEGIFSHFSRADEKDKSCSEAQYAVFSEFVERLEERGVRIPIKHIGNTGTILAMPGFDLDMVRAGIALYGLYPSEETKASGIKLTPAMRLTAPVIFVKTIASGSHVGYGGSFTAERPTRVATIPVGYADGYPRNLSNKGSVLIKGQRAPIIGRVCMDQFMVDVTDIPGVAEGDTAVLIGKDGADEITVEETAALAGTFNYEFICLISKRVPRVFISGGQIVGSIDHAGDRCGADINIERR